MKMQVCDVKQKDSGKIWLRKPIPSVDDGLMVKICHDASTTTSSLTGHHQVRFLHTAFNSSGDRFIAGDHQGAVYVFDITSNRFQLVQKTGQPCTSLAFTLRRKSEYLAALSDCSLKCFDTNTREMVAWMKGHATPMHSISVHASGRYALTTSSDTSLLWDLDTFTRKRKLNVRNAVGICKVFFLPLSNTIMTCFRDDSIFAWESDTLQCKYQLPTPPGQTPHYKAFAVPRDGRLLVAGGKSSCLHVWALDTHKLLRTIAMPAKVCIIKQLEFLPECLDGGLNRVVGVLSQGGIAHFVSVSTCRLLFDLGSLRDRVSSLSISPTGRHITATVESGGVNVYSVPALMSDFNKPPPVAVKVVSAKQKAISANKTPTATLRSTTPTRILMQDGETPGSTHLTTTGIKRIDNNMDTVDPGEVSALPNSLDTNRLRAILRGYGEYPTKYRIFIWRSLLCLPENYTAFSSLANKGTHAAWAKVHEEYPIKSRKLLRVLQRTLSALAHWSAIFGETDYLPLLVFPFVKLFQNNLLVCFEMIATVLSNWGQHWYEFFPNVPITVLSVVENCLAYHDRAVLQHFVKYGVTSQVYAWPLLQTLLSEVVTKEEWLRLWDNIFSNHPAFLLIVIVSYIICSRQPLLQCTDTDDFKYFFHHRNAVHIGTVISEAYSLWDSTPEEIHPKGTLADFRPLTRGQYPIFNKYPKFIVDYQAQERERIRQDELDYLDQRQTATELQRELDRYAGEEVAWYRQQKLLLDDEKERRQMVAREDSKLADQRTRLQAMKRELRLRELQLLDSTKRNFMQHHQRQKEAEIDQLNDEITQKRLLRDEETKEAVDDVEVQSLELDTHKQLLEQDRLKRSSAVMYKQKADKDTYRRQGELARQRAWEEQDEQLDTRKSNAASSVTKETRRNSPADYQLRIEQLEKELRNSQLSRQSDEVKIDQEVQAVMKRIAGRKLRENPKESSAF